MEINGAQIIVTLLERQGIKQIAGIPGGSNLPIYDALNNSSIKHVLTRHEQGAGFVAQGMARVSGKAGVCLACSGPGTTNLVTAVADAYMDSIPLIAITGQVASHLIGTDAFQETDTYGLMLPITKHNFLVRSAEELLDVIPTAFRIALSGRPGPVSIDIPKDVQQQVITVVEWPDIGRAPSPTAPPADGIAQLCEMLEKAQRPVLMVGGGITHSGCANDVIAFVEQQNIPTVASFMGLGALPSTHPLFLGMLGMHGARYTNMVLEECDLLIGAGVRFDDRATGKVSQFCPQASIIHIDIDGSEIGKIKAPQLAIRADVGAVLRACSKQLHVRERPVWCKRTTLLKQNYGLSIEADNDLFQPYNLLLSLAQLTDSETNIVTDVGQHQMWTAQVFPFYRSRQWISSGGLGTMGFGLPAAIGAALAQPDRMVLCISGDGSIMMNIQELDTAVEHDLNIKIVIMNNGNLGLVRQQQTLFYGARHTAIYNRRKLNFAALAESIGAKGFDLAKSKDPKATLFHALTTPGPCVINVDIHADAMVLPMVPPGAANIDMLVEHSR